MTHPTVFSDEDIRRFEDWAIDCYTSDKFYCRTHDIHALLARLKAAEILAHARHDSSKVYLAKLEAWRKSCGK